MTGYTSLKFNFRDRREADLNQDRLHTETRLLARFDPKQRLFVAQSDHGVDAHRAAARDVTGE